MAFEHKHTDGVWKKAQNPFGEPLIVTQDNEVIAKFIVHNPNHEADRQLCLKAPELRQLAEMFYDYLKNNKQENSMVMGIVKQVLTDCGVTFTPDALDRELHKSIESIEKGEEKPQMELLIQQDDFIGFEQKQESKARFYAKVLQTLSLDFETIKSEMELERDLGDVLIYNWEYYGESYMIQCEAPGTYSIYKFNN